MAQQIQFISCTQAQYDAATKTSSKIYFITDTHRIYKGSDLYAATDFDQITFSTLEASSLTVNGSAVALDGHVHTMAQVTGLSTSLSAIDTKLSGITETSITKASGTFTTLKVGTSNVALSGHTHSINDVTNLSATLSGITQTDITKTGTVTAATGSFTNLTVGGSNVALSGHTHSKADITDFTHTHSINDVVNLSASLSGITQANISKSGYVSAPTISGTTVKGGTGSFTTVSAGTVSATTGSFSTLKVGGVSVALVGHKHTAADLSGITFDEMTVDQFVASSITVDGKAVATQEWVLSNAGGWQEGNDLRCQGLTASGYAWFTSSILVTGNLTASSDAYVAGTIYTNSIQITQSNILISQKSVATQEWVMSAIESAIGAILSSQY